MTKKNLPRILPAVGLFLLCVGCATARAPQAAPQTAEGFIDRGIQSALLGNYEAAVLDFADAQRLNPDLSEARMLRGRALLASESTVHSVGPRFEWIQIHTTLALGAGFFSAEQIVVFERAAEDFSHALRLDPSNAAAYFERGLVRLQTGDFDMAIADFTESIRLNPDSAWAFRDRGFAHDMNGNAEAAIADLTEALRLDPSDARALNRRGSLHFARGDFAEAIADMTETVRLDPGFAVALITRGNAHFAEGNLDLAVEDFTEAMRLGVPVFAQLEALYRRGNAHRAGGNLSAAVADFEAALRINPNHGGAQAALEEARGLQGI